MGLEANCIAWLDGQVSEGKAQLESEQVIFRGEFKITVPFHSIRRLSESEGKLSIFFGAGTLVLDLGGLAPKWEHKIRNPKPLLDKLGVKPGMKVSVQGVRDAGFLKGLVQKDIQVSKKRAKMSDIIFLQVDSKSDLRFVHSAAKNLVQNGALWIIYPKGKQELKQKDIFKAGKSANLVDVKIVSFSSTYSALKFVIPVSMRV